MRPGLTEGEARVTMCPVLPLDQGAPARCFASNCMAWRWVDPPLTNEPEHVRRPMRDQRKGFCGIAGPIDTVVDWNT